MLAVWAVLAGLAIAYGCFIVAWLLWMVIAAYVSDPFDVSFDPDAPPSAEELESWYRLECLEPES